MKILILGDLRLDRYLWGSCTRISPEAPVQVVDVRKCTLAIGGAGNVVNNLIALGASVFPVGVIGDDEQGATLRTLMQEKGIPATGIITQKGRRTSEKTWVVAAHQRVVRFDVEAKDLIADKSARQLVALVAKKLPKTALIILSDYGKGVLTDEVTKAVITMARSQSVPVFCDPKGKDYAKYRGATIITPNRKEAAEASGIEIADDASLRLAGAKLMKDLRLEHLLVILSEEGMALFSGSRFLHFPTVAREVFDMSGADDTTIAALAFAYASGMDMADACRFANKAAGIVVGKLGTATMTLAEIEAFDRPAAMSATRKIVTRKELRLIVEGLKKQKKRIVFTNGCFDILHAGHVSYLERSKAYGDVLVVGLNSDASVRRLKGAGRPINTEQDRALILAGLAAVDHIALFDEDTPRSLISEIVPDILIKGADYRDKQVVGADIVKRHGGRVELIEMLEGRSTTEIVKRIKPPSSPPLTRGAKVKRGDHDHSDRRRRFHRQ